MCRALSPAAASCAFSPTHRRAGVLLVRRIGRAIVGPLTAKATSITNGLQYKLWARNGLWEPTPSLAVFRPPCKGGWGFSFLCFLGHRPGSSFAFVVHTCSGWGFHIPPPCRMLSWTGHWGLRLQSSPLLIGWPSGALVNWAVSLSSH